MRRRIEIVLQGVAAERRTPYGEGVIDLRNATLCRRWALAPPGARQVVRHDA
jgi:hypothetical protein